MDVGNTGIEERVESLDETVEFDFQLVRANGGSVDRCVESRRVASGVRIPIRRMLLFLAGTSISSDGVGWSTTLYRYGVLTTCRVLSSSVSARPAS